MGAHPDHAFHKAFHHWRKRALEAEQALKDCERDRAILEEHNANLLRRLREWHNHV